MSLVMELLESFWNFVNVGISKFDGDVALTVAILTICCFCFFFYKKIKNNTAQVLKDIIEANKLINFEDDHRSKFYRQFESINNNLKKNKSFAHHWQEFVEHIIFPTEAEASQKSEDELEIKNSIQPNFFFNEEKFIEDNIDLRFLDSIPGKITGLGILGTFIGLTIGIASATVGLDGLESANTSQLKDTLAKLLGGASLAFITSVLGISFSMGFSFWEKMIIKKIRDNLKKFVQSLEKSLKLITDEQISLEIKENIIEQNKKFDGFSNDLTIALGNALKDPLNDGIEKIVSSLTSIKDVQQGFSDDLMSKLVDTISGSLTTEVNSSQEKASETFQNLQDTLSKQVDKMVSSQKTMEETSRQLINEFSQKNAANQDILNEQLNHTVRGLRDSLDEINQSFKENINHSSEKIKKTLDQTFDNVSNNIITQQQNMNSKMETSANNLESLIQKVSDLMEASNENIEKNKNITVRYDEIVGKYKQLIRDQENIFGLLENCSSNILSSSQKFDNTGVNLLSVSQKLEGTSGQLNENNQKLKNIWADYEDRFKNVDESLGGAFEIFVKGSNQFHDTVNKYVGGLTQEYERAISILGERLEELGDILSVNEDRGLSD